MIVVDASVAVKWFLPEADSDVADELLASERELHGPDLLGVEVAATLVRGANIDATNRSDAEANLQDFQELVARGDLTLWRMRDDQLRAATELAMDLRHPLKDCIYLGLARELGCRLVTADARFAARAGKVYDDVQVLSAQ